MHTHTHDDDKIKTTDKASILYKRAKSIRVGLKETDESEALPAVGTVIDYTAVILE